MGLRPDGRRCPGRQRPPARYHRTRNHRRLRQPGVSPAGTPGRGDQRGPCGAIDPGVTWVVLTPESGSSRARDLLAGLQHERALWVAPEPHATRASALATLLQVAMGDPWPSVPPGLFAEVFPAACARLGIATPDLVDAVVLPEPRAAAYLVAELDGRLARRGDEVWMVPSPAASGSPLLQS